MSKCNTCKNSHNCKEREAHTRFEELVAVGEDVNCTGYEYQKPLSYEETKELWHKRFVPTADVVEVVRCKDCKRCEFYYPEKKQDGEMRSAYYCHLNKSHIKPTDYCSYGERRERNER